MKKCLLILFLALFLTQGAIASVIRVTVKGTVATLSEGAKKKMKTGALD